MQEPKIGGSYSAARGYGVDLPLHSWRATLAKSRGEPGIEWALRVTRLETHPERAIQLMTDVSAEIPAEARPIFQGAQVLLASLAYTLPPDRTPELNAHGLASRED